MVAVETNKISLRPSWIGAGLLSAGHIAALGWCLYGLPAFAKLGVGTLIAYSGWRSVWHGALMRGRDSVREIEPTDGKCAVRTNDGNWSGGRIADTSRVMPFLLVIDLNTDAGKRLRRLIVPRDALSAEEFRQLRVWLRWRHGKPASQGHP